MKEHEPPLDYLVVREILRKIARILNVAPCDVLQRIKALLAELADLERQLAERRAIGVVSADDLLANAVEVDGAVVIVTEMSGAAGAMRQLIDQIRKRTWMSAILLASRYNDRVTLVAGVSRNLQSYVDASQWVRPVAEVVGGGGGGRPDMAQAGGCQPAKLPDALEMARKTILDMLTNGYAREATNV